MWGSGGGGEGEREICGVECSVTMVSVKYEVQIQLPHFRDQTPPLLLISSHDLLRLLCEGGH